MNRLWKFFFKDTLHVLAGSALFVAVLLSVLVGIGRAFSICAWVVTVLLLLAARLSDSREENWKKNAVEVTATVRGIKQVHLTVHMSATHYANEDAIHPYVILYDYKVAGKKYHGKSQWLWLKPGFPEGMKIKIKVDPADPTKSRFGE